MKWNIQIKDDAQGKKERDGKRELIKGQKQCNLFCSYLDRF